MCECGNKRNRKKENETNFFSVCYRSAQFDFFHVYIYIGVTGRKFKKSGKKREESCSTTTSLFSLYCVCVCSSSSLSVFFPVCVRTFGVCKYINASESSRQREKREKRGKKIGAENEWETHELFYAFSMLIIVTEEERKEKSKIEK